MAGLETTVTPVLLTLNLLVTAAGVVLDGLERTVTHAPWGGCHQIAAPVDSDSAQRVTVLNVSRMESGQEQLTARI